MKLGLSPTELRHQEHRKGMLETEDLEPKPENIEARQFGLPRGGNRIA